MADSSESTPKKRKLSNSTENLYENDVHKESLPSFNSFKNFEVVKILNNNPDRMSVAVEGRFKGHDEVAVVFLQKCPFKEEELERILSDETSLQLLFNNDIYYNQIATLLPQLNGVKVSAIYPADEKHINKFMKQTVSYIEETPEIYKNVTLPFIENSSYSNQWIYNILEHKKEKDRIVCEDLDPDIGFIMIPDLKWNGECKENLYLMAVVMRRDISSIRDLTEKHLPLLENIYTKCTKAIKDKYGVPQEELRIYFHYQPSFYHLHIHFTAVTFDAPGSWIGKAYLLTTVINNLKLMSDYFQKSTLSYAIPKNHSIYKRLEEYGYFNG